MRFFNGHKAIFNFRIDVDHFYPKHVLKVLEIAEKYDKKMTWFITLNHAKQYPNIIKRIAKTQDIQSHAFFHNTYNTEKENFDNLYEAHKFFDEIEITVCGFAAPFGSWNESLGKALEQMNYLYSSEFRRGTKIFPFYPVVGKKKSKVLQVPVHGVSLGDLLDRGYSVKQVVIYFEKIIDFFYDNKIPIFLYGHPERRLGKYPQVLEAIFEKINSKEDVFYTTLTNYAKIWAERGFENTKNHWKNHKIFIEDRSNFMTRIIRKVDLKLFYIFEKIGI